MDEMTLLEDFRAAVAPPAELTLTRARERMLGGGVPGQKRTRTRRLYRPGTRGRLALTGLTGLAAATAVAVALARSPLRRRGGPGLQRQSRRQGDGLPGGRGRGRGARGGTGPVGLLAGEEEPVPAWSVPTRYGPRRTGPRPRTSPRVRWRRPGVAPAAKPARTCQYVGQPFVAPADVHGSPSAG